MPDYDFWPHTADAASVAPRRRLLHGAAGVVLAWLLPARASGQEPQAAARARPAPGDGLVKVGDASRRPLTASDIAPGAPPVMAWPLSAESGVARSGSRLNRVLLVRLDASGLNEATRARAVEGIVAFSAICTHTGCEVGEYLAEEQQLYCECHQSKFDPRDGARVTDGPAPRPLPALPLRVDDGRLVVAAPFTSRPGFEQG